MDIILIEGNHRLPMVGGGPANTAKAIARLGQEVQFIGGISSDPFGIKIEEELLRSGVDLSHALRVELPTALAIATIDSFGSISYDFKFDDTASFAFDSSWFPVGTPKVIHIGSLATIIEPGASHLLKWSAAQTAPIIFDPNVRPSIEGDKDIYRESVERWIDVASIVKLSEEDLGWLYADESVVKTWLDRGVSLVVITRGEKGLSALGRKFRVHVPAVSVSVIDTVGAGDTIGAVLVEGLLEHGLSDLSGNALFSVLERAAKAAAITCSRAGANPPWKSELE